MVTLSSMSWWSYIVGKGLNGIALSSWSSASSACSQLSTSSREKRRILHSLLHSQEVWIMSAHFSDSLISMTFGIFLVVMLSSSCSCSFSLWMMISLMCHRIKYQCSKYRIKISFVILLLKVVRDGIKVYVLWSLYLYHLILSLYLIGIGSCYKDNPNYC